MAAQTSARGHGPIRLTLTRPADIAVLIGILSAAWLFDLGVHSGDIGLAFSASLVVAASALLVGGRPRNGWSRILLAAAAVMAPWLMLRASPWLQWPDLVVTLGLLSGAAVLASDGSPFSVTFALMGEWCAGLSSNLAQAAAICLYELHKTWLARKPTTGSMAAAATFEAQERMFDKLRDALEEIHFLYGDKADARSVVIPGTGQVVKDVGGKEAKRVTRT